MISFRRIISTKLYFSLLPVCSLENCANNFAVLFAFSFFSSTPKKFQKFTFNLSLVYFVFVLSHLYNEKFKQREIHSNLYFRVCRCLCFSQTMRLLIERENISLRLEKTKKMCDKYLYIPEHIRQYCFVLFA